MLRGFCAAGRPNQRLKPWGSFEGWSDLIRGTVVWCGLPDPGECRESLLASDVDSSLLLNLLRGWKEVDPNGVGMSASEAIERMDMELNDKALLRRAVCELCQIPYGKLPSARTLGNKLRKYKGRIAGKMKFCNRILDGITRWFVLG
jgi:hypothetical protein